jgi:hypothetical protein
LAVTKLKTYCKRGHPFDEANTYIAANGTRQCKACREAYRQRPDYKAKHRAYMRAYQQTPAYKAKHRAYMRAYYRQTPA